MAAYTPEGMLAAPRRSTANVNPSGEIAFFSSTTYNWTSHESSTTWNILDVASGNVTDAPFDSSVSEIVWVGPTNTSILYINGTNDEVPGGVTLYTADLAEEFSPTLVASLEAPFQGLKAVQTEDGSINFVVNSLAYWTNGSAYNPELVSEPLTTGQIYDANFVRHWDVYLTQERYAIYGGSLTAGNSSSYTFDGTVKNLLWGINATVTRPETPVQPFGDQGDYDLSPDGQTVAFLTKSPDLPKANYTASYIYLVPHDGSEVAVPVNGPGTTAPEYAQGASASPRWSPDGTKIAFAQQAGISYESDRFQLYVASVDGLSSEVTPVAKDWDSSPSLLLWGHDSEELYVASELYASVRLWIVPADAEDSYKPSNFTGAETSVADFAILPDGSALVSSAAAWTSRAFYIQSPGTEKKVLFTANEVDSEISDLTEDSVIDFWYENEDGDLIQTFVFLPTDFDSSKKYPWVFNVHGGPQSSQGNSWSTRWNLRLWADQGFVVTSPQFTGTPSYSQAFTDKIQNNWGGTPYQDLVTLFNYVEANISYIDTTNAVAVGASYGGFMMNWIQGHDLGRKFKAIVTHDGKTDQVGSYSTEELWFNQHDQNGTIWDNRDNYERWDPLYHLKNASTPHFVVHNDLDYRLPIAEGIQLFNILQSLGVPSRFLHFPDEGHWVLSRENSLLWHQTIFNWIKYWTGLEEELIQDIVIKQ
ncbi:dipeptidyl-peptidase-like protein V precursor [Lophiostoma macrostomum CBS 122681]|uniref:Dipeptidyl-peptidase V n=1 Tax=Lophiostoma macrostomum CBS 122681 TaxID=1314788 RepID=A0A6A6T8U4_9PLEO|nr:dipeptidyl-peptidase-like protein V precursor [Lophiostoma macrostomum CBS 122681]